MYQNLHILHIYTFIQHHQQQEQKIMYSDDERLF